TIKYLQTQLDKLKKENELLRNAVLQIANEYEPKYRDLEKRFKAIEKQVLRVIIDLIKRLRRPVTYEEIIRGYRARYLFNVKVETITRITRKLKEKGYLFSPKRGYFMLTKTNNE
ncbi:MAG: hypothetical protein J7K98_00545, partial [Candidatus Aenigmarchaeota archaeon]|nr:hypothetical protein [Candidatus Aenigmarchaeota archaeon]